ncbi:hypothetical protein AB0J74_32860 [Asanoa sp. NPDC049573]|uniref:vWA domain-containing protein n=1 Tax=Asanoa sp. NPDC049573 TaxID=3155396 RepID=UPI00342FD0AB
MADNELFTADRIVGRTDLRLPKMRYDVDTSDLSVHFSVDDLISARPPYVFAADISAAFRVTNPKEIVRRRIQDAEPWVRGHLMTGIRATARRYQLDDLNAAQDELDALFASRLVMTEGLTILGCTVTLKLREGDFKSTVELDQVLADRRIGRVRSEIDKDAAQAEQEIRGIQTDGDIEVRRRLRAAGPSSSNVEDLEREVLAINPEKAGDLLDKKREDEARRYERELAHEDKLLERRRQYELEDREWRRQERQDHLNDIDFLHGHGMLPPTDRRRVAATVIRPDDSPRSVSSTRPSAALPAGREAIPVRPTEPSPATPPASATMGGDAARRGEDERPPPVVRPPRERTPTIDMTLPQPPDATVLVQPVYLVLDESDGAAAYLPTVDEGLAQMVAALTRQGGAAAALRLAIIGIGETARTVQDFAAVRDLAPRPVLKPRGAARYAPVLDELDRRIPEDVAALKTAGHRVRRPLVFLLSLTMPTAGDPWSEAQRRLTDQASRRAAPHIAVFGVGRVDQFLIKRLATRAEFAFTSPGDIDVHAAIRAFTASLLSNLGRLAAALVEGTDELYIGHPDGFDIVTEEV